MVAVGYAAMPKTTPGTGEIAKAMVATPLLEGVSPVAVRHLADQGRMRDYRRGTYLCHQGDPADEILFLVAGLETAVTESLRQFRDRFLVQ